MAPKLYMVHTSPPVRAVLMVAKAIGLHLEQHEINFLKSDHLRPDFVKLNPSHTVPTLDDDGFALWDSHAILTYIVEKYAKDDSLYPNDIKTKAIIQQILHFETGILFNRLSNITRPMWKKGKKIIDHHDRDAIIESYGLMEATLKGKKWVAGGNSYTIADYSLVATISTIDVLIPIDAQQFPKLMNWWKMCENLPGYEANKPGLNEFAERMKIFMS